MKKAKKDARGGSGRNQGRKPKFSEETTTFSCRVPVSKKIELSQIVHIKLLEWSNKGDG